MKILKRNLVLEDIMIFIVSTQIIIPLVHFKSDFTKIAFKGG